jgi:quercetin dioxygenase-like cupin family protein
MDCHLIKTSLSLIGIVAIIAFASCKNNQNKKVMRDQNNASLFPKGDKLTNGYFTGEAFLNPLLAKDKNNEFALGCVTFEPGARTNWHTHPKGQVLIVVEGEGFNQEKGKPVQKLKKGDVVNIPENTEHWHGASAKSKLVHIAITNYKADENVVWLNPVSDEEYKEVNQ